MLADEETESRPGRNRNAATRAVILFGVGSAMLTVAGCFGLLPIALNVQPISPWISIGIALVGLALVLVFGFQVPVHIAGFETKADRFEEPERSSKLYGLYLVGTGFGLLLQAFLCSIVFVAVSWSVGRGRDGFVFQQAEGAEGEGQTGELVNRLGELFGSSAGEAYHVAGLFVLSSMVALLGAFFFFCNALWKRMGEPERDPFDRRVFWAGLWFRLGEALLFNLVFFLVLRYYAPEQFLLLPLVSLLIGMFLKAGESLVSGIATRVFASIQALVPTDLGKRRILRLITLQLAGPGANEAAEAPEAIADWNQRLDSAVQGVRNLDGVEEVVLDREDRSLRVEYDASTAGPKDVRRKLTLQGIRTADPQ